MQRPTVQATIHALRRLAQGLPADEALIREYLGRYAEDFLKAFDAVVRPTHAARVPIKLGETAEEILERLRKTGAGLAPRDERFQALIDTVSAGMADLEKGKMSYRDFDGTLHEVLAELHRLGFETPLTPRQKAFEKYVENLLIELSYPEGPFYDSLGVVP